MPPVGVGASRFASALETGTAKLWILLIGVNYYRDPSLPSLQYAAVDCQGIGAALDAATQTFPDREFLIHHDLVAEIPILARVESSLYRVVREARVDDTVLIYFSGHGVLEPISQQTILCFRDTECEKLLSTGLQIEVLLEMLGNCAAHSQLVWLDACHSGNLNLIVRKHHHRRAAGDRPSEQTLLNPTPKLLELLHQRAVKSRGFYALLSCDEGQQSWEFPDLGHGVFSYYLMRGLSGEAADSQGSIDADGLYRYVYRQTTQYIDRINQQLRLVNQAKRERGDMTWCPEYSPQTPKRIVSGVGEIILGIQPQTVEFEPDRQALIIDGGADIFSNESLIDNLSHVLETEGKFTIDRESIRAQSSEQLHHRIHTFLSSSPSLNNRNRLIQTTSTRLLYLRGQIIDLDGEDAWFLVGDGVKVSRIWLRQELYCASHIQQIIILDCPGATVAPDWVEALKIDDGCAQCIIACAAPVEDGELFALTLLEALISAPSQVGMSVVSLFRRLQTNLAQLEISCYFWIAITQGLIEIVPGISGADPVKLLSNDLPTIGRLTAKPLELDRSSLELLELRSAQAITEIRQEVEVPVEDCQYIEYTNSQLSTPHPVNSWIESIAPKLLSTEFTDSLESILRPLVGAIAPVLIAEVSNRSQVRDSETFVTNLLPLLPDRYHHTFTSQVKILLGQQPKVLSPPLPDPISSTPSPKTSSALVVSPPQSHFTPAARVAIEQTLCESIGPVARVLLAQIEPMGWINDLSLLAALTPYLTATQLAEFTPRLQAIVESSTTADFVESSNRRGITPIQEQIAINDRSILICEQELTIAIGPVAKFIVANTLQANPHSSLLDFVTALSTAIPDPDRAETFRRRMISTERRKSP